MVDIVGAEVGDGGEGGVEREDGGEGAGQGGAFEDQEGGVGRDGAEEDEAAGGLVWEGVRSVMCGWGREGRGEGPWFKMRVGWNRDTRDSEGVGSGDSIFVILVRELWRIETSSR